METVAPTRQYQFNGRVISLTSKWEGTMILGGTIIRQRLENGEIFREGTWEESCIKEASTISVWLLTV